MFDYIRCELPLPDGWSGELQTKDFDCEMVEHIISKEGRLMLDRGHNEEVPLMERRSWKAEWGDSEAAQEEHLIEALAGCMRRVQKYEDANFHGLVNFCGLETVGYDPPEPGDVFKRPITVFHEYNAKFTDGQLVSIDIVHDDD
jgi:hypothetical protein